MKHTPLIVCVLSGCVGGCLSVPEGPTPQCASTADCNSSAGEVCEEGVCWGDPPEGTFAGTISPPTERGDLVPLELGAIALPPDGWFGDLVLERPVVFSGRVEAYCTAPQDCSSRLSIDATITITRPSQFAGGPGFRTVVTSEPDIASGLSFQVALPRSDSPYTITIVPTDRYDNGSLPSVFVPPLRTQITVNKDEIGKIYQLGEGPLHVIEGKVAAVGTELGLADYRVVALGRWDVNAPIGEVSTVAQTQKDGHYSVVLSDGVVGPVEIVAAPIDDSVGPVLHIANIDPAITAPRNLMMPTNLGRQKTISVLVKGGDGSGRIAPLAGARVKVSALVNPAPPSGPPSNLYVTVTSEVTTGTDGIARLDVFDGTAFAGMYRLAIVPPAGSSAAAVFNQPIALEDQDETLANRVAIGGVVVDMSGNPLDGVAVTVQPSLRFVWSLDDLPQGFLSKIPAATAVTTNTGEFVVFVDPIVADTWGTYDLVFVPKAESRAGNWIVADIGMPRDSATTSVMLDPIAIPDAAFVHGHIVDPDHLPLEDAELKLFHVIAPTALCTEVSHAPAGCPIPAVLQGRGTSDHGGVVRLTLPRP